MYDRNTPEFDTGLKSILLTLKNRVMKTQLNDTNQIAPAEERWPELDAIATPIFERVVNKINAINTRAIETDCIYVRQCVLEMVIAKLEKCV